MSVDEIIERERKGAFGFTDDRRCLFTYGDFRRLLMEIEEEMRREIVSRHSIKIPIEIMPPCNAAAMRAELEEIVGIVSEWQGSIPLGKVCKIAKAALSKPPRNCDRFNNEREMQFAFLAELLSMGRNGATLEEYSKWLLDEAKGAGNESK